MPKRPHSVPPELEDVASQVGDFIEYFGFKKIHGRIWAHLFLSPVALDASDLVERLEVSKALVSMSISDLLEHEVIHVSGKGNRGTACYCTNPHVTSVILNVLRKRERRMLARVNASIRVLKGFVDAGNSSGGTGLSSGAAGSRSTEQISADRVEVLAEMVTSAEAVLDSILQMGHADFSAFSAFMDIPQPTPPSDD